MAESSELFDKLLRGDKISGAVCDSRDSSLFSVIENVLVFHEIAASDHENNHILSELALAGIDQTKN